MYPHGWRDPDDAALDLLPIGLLPLESAAEAKPARQGLRQRAPPSAFYTARRNALGVIP